MELINTIAAISTPLGEGGIGIVRISGSDAISVLERVFEPKAGQSKPNRWISHRVHYGHIRDQGSGEIIDEVLVNIMYGPRTYTREDTVEINCHSGIVPLRQIMQLILRQGVRLAEPGEFTKRAFLNGRIDLAQAEAVIDVIRAKTERSLRLAVRQLTGRLSGQVVQLRETLLEVVAYIEAGIDFPDDEINELTAGEIGRRLRAAADEVAKLLQTADQGRILREGLETVIVGKPNVGKSSLLNALLRENRAIVTDQPGTTRDIIEESLNIRGVPIKIIDTAGIRHSDDLIEQIGVERAKDSLHQAELVLYMLDDAAGISGEDREIAARLPGKRVLVLVNKTDLGGGRISDAAVRELLPDPVIIRMSVTAGEGVNELEEAVAELVFSGDLETDDGAMVSNLRHQQALEAALEHLNDGCRSAADGIPPDIMVIDIRAAWEKLGEVTGETVTDDILDRIFSQFCLGK